MPTGAIDIHHHYVPRSLLEAARTDGKRLGVELQETSGEKALSFAGSRPFLLHPELPAVDQRLQMMEDSRVATAVLGAHTATLGYRLSGDGGERWCRIYNEGIKELVVCHPDRFVGLAAVPLQDAARAAKVLEQAIRDLGLSGGYIGTNVNGSYYGSTDFDPFWAKAQELDALIVMHPEDVAGGDKMNSYGLKLVCGNPADSALALGFMTYSGVFDRFSNLKLCVLHGGGFFPYHIGRFDHGFDVRAGTRAPQARWRPSAYLKNLYFDSLVYRVDTLDYLRRVAGADHIMVGTDYPFFPLGDWNAVGKIEGLDCQETEKQAMLHGNARRLLKISQRYKTEGTVT